MTLSAAAPSRTPGASAEAIQFHYDVGDEFYRLWLDPAMVYSSALWEKGDDLATAQMRKIDWHLQRAGVRRGDRLLDIGCGWGALLQRAVTEFGVQRATGLTLSRTQAQAMRDMDLPQVEVRLESWISHSPQRPYDAMVSIGAFEHFARTDQSDEEKIDAYRRFFEFCHRSLRPDGRLSLQTICYEKSDRGSISPFISQQIFPETELPHLHEIAKAMHGLFEIEELRNDRAHYAQTLRCWLANLRARKREAIEVVGADVVGSYEKYLSLSIVAFHVGAFNLARIAMRRIDPERVMAKPASNAIQKLGREMEDGSPRELDLQREPFVVTHDGGRAQRVHVGVAMALSAVAFGAAIVETVAGRAQAWEFALCLTMYLMVGLGISLGFHRMLSHRSFRPIPILKALLVVFGSMAAQGRPIYWVGNHRRHHRFSDTADDPHSPLWVDGRQPARKLRGWWHAHVGWLLSDRVTNTTLYSRDLFQDRLVVWLNKHYFDWIVLGLAIPAMAGAAIEASVVGALKGLLWGGGVRFFFSYHITGATNSFGHMFGTRPFATRENSTNNWWLVIPTLGDGWHNNHHACPSSAFHGFRWWEIDIGRWVIQALEALHLVSDVVRPNEALLEGLRARQGDRGSCAK